jgi:hypothetical protein
MKHHCKPGVSQTFFFDSHTPNRKDKMFVYGKTIEPRLIFVGEAKAIQPDLIFVIKTNSFKTIVFSLVQYL